MFRLSQKYGPNLIHYLNSKFELRYSLVVCCVLQDLVAFSEKHEIQLLTHADPKGACLNVNEEKLVHK